MWAVVSELKTEVVWVQNGWFVGWKRLKNKTGLKKKFEKGVSHWKMGGGVKKRAMGSKTGGGPEVKVRNRPPSCISSTCRLVCVVHSTNIIVRHITWILIVLPSFMTNIIVAVAINLVRYRSTLSLSAVSGVPSPSLFVQVVVFVKISTRMWKDINSAAYIPNCDALSYTIWCARGKTVEEHLKKTRIVWETNWTSLSHSSKMDEKHGHLANHNIIWGI